MLQDTCITWSTTLYRPIIARLAHKIWDNKVSSIKFTPQHTHYLRPPPARSHHRDNTNVQITRGAWTQHYNLRASTRRASPLTQRNEHPINGNTKYPNLRQIIRHATQGPTYHTTRSEQRGNHKNRLIQCHDRKISQIKQLKQQKFSSWKRAILTLGACYDKPYRNHRKQEVGY